MPLILAVEPDRRQAVNLAAVLRQRPRTELVVSGCASAALEALGNRVPDVLLTSPLLSRQDEMALAQWMDALGPAGAHVQSLTIPILATDVPPPKKRGVFSRLRRTRAAETPNGCEPSTFAEQVGMYLQRAEPEPAPEPEQVLAIEPMVAAAVVEDIPAVAEIPVVEEIPVVGEILVVEEQPLSLAAVRLGFADRLRALATPSDRPTVLALPALAMSASRVNADLDDWRLMLLAPPAVDPTPVAGDAPGVDTQPLSLAAVRLGFADRLRALAKPSDRPTVLTLPALAMGASRVNADLDDWRLMLLARPAPEAAPAPASEAPVQRHDEPWVELPIEELSLPVRVPLPAPPVLLQTADDVWVLRVTPELTQLIERVEPCEPSAPTLKIQRVQTVQKVQETRKAAKPKTVSKRAPRPLQDEWGFFDPSQCGFSALIAKLDEIAEHEDAREPTPETTSVRILVP